MLSEFIICYNEITADDGLLLYIGPELYLAKVDLALRRRLDFIFNIAIPEQIVKSYHSLIYPIILQYIFIANSLFSILVEDS